MSIQPWITCLQSGILIRHLETHYPEQASKVDLQRVMGAAESFHEIQDARAFLTDTSNWIPHSVFRELVKGCELATGQKDFTYQAALAYYETVKTQSPTLIETIAILLNDVESVFRSVGDWASAYTNYLQLQSFVCPDEAQTLHILSRYLPPVDPGLGNMNLVQGNIEGIAKLDPSVETASCEEAYSQMRLEALVNEFGDAYSITTKNDRITVTRRSTGELVIAGRAITLVPELVPVKEDRIPVPQPRDEQLIARIEPLNRLAIWTVGDTSRAPKDLSSNPESLCTAIRIERGGTLSAGSLSTTIKTGAIYSAPYTHYCLRWTNRPPLANNAAVVAGGSQLLTDRRAFAHRLFAHLKNLQATHRHMLTMFLRNVELAQENIQLKQELSAQQETCGIIGKSIPLQDLLSLIRTIAPSDTTVLVTGETGTGKELAARLIHQLSRRKDRRFVAVNCGALPETLLESELFGHEKGSFTGAIAQKKGKFELAEGGTLFLDEIGDISSSVQVKLLRVLQEREFQRVGGTSDLKANIRLIAATNRDLQAMMEQNQFRQDLFYRLNVIQLYIPALRERPEDIPELANHFVHHFADKTGKAIAGLTPDALQLCLTYKWPGNIRELENIMERAVTLAPEGKKWITPDLLPNNLRSTTESAPSVDIAELIDRIEWGALLKTLEKSGSLTELLNHVEWSITRRAIAEYGGNKSRAAKILGRTYRWLRKLESEMTGPQSPGHNPSEKS
ncbi:MAG TPA: sigma 54-interacting transcriptional regulator [Nitrospiraceae bacterium]|jgi:DNA-binding NtrC family response regulator|nr:sigma 54-interacting transcriptional regulator [Nitrospiraceae bacterium]